MLQKVLRPLRTLCKLTFTLLSLFIVTNIVMMNSLQPSDLDGNPVNLRFVKFQNVQTLLIFVKDNQGGTETTRIDHLAVYGCPLNTTNMSDFKRIAGKKGEAH
jgi:PITH domain